MICAVEPSLKFLQETTQKKNSVTSHTCKRMCPANLLFFCLTSLYITITTLISPRAPCDETGLHKLGTRQNTRHLPYPAPTQLCTHSISFWCCCRMAETTQQTSATGNKTNLSQTPLTHPRQQHPATLYRDMTTRGAPATTSASPLMKKSITKGQ